MTQVSGRESFEFVLGLSIEDRKLYLAKRLEVYRDVCVQAAATMLRERGDKKTVAEAEAQAVIETDGLIKSIPLEAALYPLLLGGEVVELKEFTVG